MATTKNIAGSIPPWLDRHTVLKRFKVGPGKKWIGLIVGKEKQTGNPVLRLYKYLNWFSIKSPNDLTAVRQVLDAGAKELGWNASVSTDELSQLMSENERLREIKGKKAEEIKKHRDVIQKLLAESGKLREQHLALGLETFKNDIKEFSELLSTSSREHELQDWLFKHTWLFGPEYIDGSIQEITREGDKVDFLLQRYDTFHDVFEIKLASKSLFVGTSQKVPEQMLSRTFTPSADVKDGISQVIGYLESYSLDTPALAWTRGINAYKPKGTLIIGRSKQDEKRARRTLNSYLHGVEILTYDNILERGKNLIKLLERRYASRIKK